ncbi:hypothetical protein ACO34A_09915 [Rhizobium sp. ACO-34A]|nr:hypothetical protein [Rhizobium sp. ACO-34A]ATN34121.1 hypothetical protein ACO34A_09915 [Rhizobium sp. ACO-34A]
MDDNERRRIEGLTVEEFDGELFTRFGVRPRLKVKEANLRNYDLNWDTAPEPDTDAYRLFGIWTMTRGLEYCDYLHDQGRY